MKKEEIANDFVFEAVGGKTVWDVGCDLKEGEEVIGVYDTVKGRENSDGSKQDKKKEVWFQFETYQWQKKIARVTTWAIDQNCEVNEF